MATKKRTTSTTRTARSHNNNPEGKNQYSRSPLTTAAAGAVVAAAAGAFLWSKRDKISEQLSQLGEQFGEWRESMLAKDETLATDETDHGEGFIARSPRKSRKTQAEIAEEALTLKETGQTEPVIM